MSFPKTTAAAVLGLALLASCEQVITVDPPEYERKLVVDCFQDDADSSIRVAVQRNIGVLENLPDSAYSVRGAKVEWLESGTVVHTMTTDDFNAPPPGQQDYRFWRYYGVNASAPLLTPGKTYEIRVSHPDFPSVSAVQVAPFPPKIDGVTVKIDSTTGGSQNSIATFSITIDDPGTEKNYYEIQLRDVNTQYPAYLSTDDPNARYGIRDDRIIVDDELFNGKKHTIRVSKDFYGEDEWAVTVRSVTYDWYKFGQTARANEESSYNPFASPVRVHTNVEGGLGLFGLAGKSEVIVTP